jgi:hypothetical protein
MRSFFPDNKRILESCDFYVCVDKKTSRSAIQAGIDIEKLLEEKEKNTTSGIASKLKSCERENEALNKRIRELAELLEHQNNLLKSYEVILKNKLKEP